MPYRHPQELGGSIDVQDEGSSIVNPVKIFDFIGGGVAATDGGANTADITITGAAINKAFDEVPTGAIDSVNVTFTLANTPSPAGSLRVRMNRQTLIITTDYSLSTDTITFIDPPETGSIIKCTYEH